MVDVEAEIIAEFDMDIHVLCDPDINRGIRTVAWEGAPGDWWVCITAVGLDKAEADRLQSGLKESIETQAKRACEEVSRERLPTGVTLTHLLHYKTERTAVRAGRELNTKLAWVTESLSAPRQ